MQVLRSRLLRTGTAAGCRQRGPRSARVRSARGDRSQRIRTYNFPQGRVTDHRIGLTLYKLDQLLEGTALDELIDALVTEQQATQLAAINQDVRT